VVSTRVGGIPHQVTEDCGALVEPGDVDALRRAIDALAGDPDRLRAMGQHARERVRTEFTWARAAETAAGSYRRILERAGATAPKGTEPQQIQVA
jgi:glycosyltransferase involved in cell wall biosynthesis